MGRNLCLLLAVAALPASARGELGVTVKTLDPESIAGQLRSFSLRGGLLLRGRPGIPASEVVGIFTNVEPQDPVSRMLRLDLVGGDRLHGQVLSGDEEALTIGTRVIGELRVGLDRIELLVTPAGRGPDFAERVAELRKVPAPDEDILLLANGDRLTGLIAQIDEQRVLLEREDRSLPVVLEKVVAIRFAESDPQPQTGLHATLWLDDHSVITVEDLNWTGPRAEARFAGQRIKLAAENLLRVEVSGGRWVWLSELDPVSFQHTPTFSLSWPWQRDRNVLGGPIRLGGRAFDRGIGVHSESVLIYELAAEFERFVAYVGVDDDAGPLADVDVDVRLDGESRFQASHLRAGQRPQRIDLPLNGAKRLELIVRFGQNADIQDRVDWAGAALIRKKAPGNRRSREQGTAR